MYATLRVNSMESGLDTMRSKKLCTMRGTTPCFSASSIDGPSVRGRRIAFGHIGGLGMCRNKDNHAHSDLSRALPLDSCIGELLHDPSKPRINESGTILRIPFVRVLSP